MAENLNDKWKQAVEEYEAKQRAKGISAPTRPHYASCLGVPLAFVATFAGIIWWFTPPKHASQTRASTSQSAPLANAGSETKGQTVLETYTFKLKALSSGLKRYPDFDLTLDDPKTRIQSLVATFGTFGRTYNEAAGLSLDAEAKEAQRAFKTLAGQSQARTFPKLRKMQGEIFKTGLWENDVEVTTLGADHSTLRLTAGMFAANRNIKEMYETLRPTLVGLRFKKIVFKWYRGSGQTYYNIGTVSDDTLAEIKYDAWIPVS
jgi:hypothetical protein